MILVYDKLFNLGRCNRVCIENSVKLAKAKKSPT